MATRFGLPFSVITQPNYEMAGLFNVTATPFMTVIDSTGTVVEKGVANVRNKLEELIRTLHGVRDKRIPA